MRITVIVADAVHTVHVGGEVERRTRTFDAPPELAAYVERVTRGNAYASVSLAIEDEQQGGTPE